MALQRTPSIERFRQLREFRLAGLIGQGLPEHAEIEVCVRWPLYFLPIVLFNQLLTPHPVWIVLFVALVGLYGAAIYWVREHARNVSLSHKRLGERLIVGDIFEEEFEIVNQGFVPVIWTELEDYSRYPEAKQSQVAACGGNSTYKWRRKVACTQRGVYRLGPYGLRMGDPFGLLQLRLSFPKEEIIVIYPRVVQMSHKRFPHGQSTGTDRRRKSILGATPAYSVLDYQPGDSLRRIHWRVTAHRGKLMVRELETEPTGDIWIILDLFAGAQRGTGPLSTLEFGIVAAASLAASLLSGTEGRAVGLLAHSGASEGGALPVAEQDLFGVQIAAREGGTVAVRPKAGPGQLWQILTALAPVQAGPQPLGQVLSGSREVFGPRSTLLVITPDVMPTSPSEESGVGSASGLIDVNAPSSSATASPVSPAFTNDNDMGAVETGFWPAELLQLRSGGLDGYAILITPNPAAFETMSRSDRLASDGSGERPDTAVHHEGVHEDSEKLTLTAYEDAARRLQELLITQRVQTDVIQASDHYAPLLTYRRRRTVVRSTPTGGVATYEVDEEIG